MLLMSAIARVVIEPLPPGVQHPGRTGRGLRIEWRDEPEPVMAPPMNRHTQRTGRAHVLVRHQLAEQRAGREAMAQRSRSYYDEWRDVRQRLWDK